MLNQLNTTTKRELDARYQSNSDIEDKLQSSKQISNTRGSLEISDYGVTESIELYFKPSQDLHGYDKPWAGGTEKNKLNPSITSQTITGITVTKNDDGSYLCTGTATADVMLQFDTFTTGGDTYILSGCPPTGSYSTYCLGVVDHGTDYGNGLTFSESGKPYIRIAKDYKCPTGGLLFKPMIRLSSVTDSTFEPYANICPITGQNKASLTWNTNQGITMNFGSTYYGGIANFDGVLSLDWQRIASYNGESLTGEWLSDRDVYASGTTPSTGAEVVYKTTPSTVRVIKPVSTVLTDDYPITYNGYKLDVTYQPKDTILAEAKTYTNEEIAKLGLPQAPTSNGTYNLVCTVASGTPTLSWKSTT